MHSHEPNDKSTETESIGVSMSFLQALFVAVCIIVGVGLVVVGIALVATSLWWLILFVPVWFFEFAVCVYVSTQDWGAFS